MAKHSFREENRFELHLYTSPTQDTIHGMTKKHKPCTLPNVRRNNKITISTNEKMASKNLQEIRAKKGGKRGEHEVLNC